MKIRYLILGLLLLVTLLLAGCGQSFNCEEIEESFEKASNDSDSLAEESAGFIFEINPSDIDVSSSSKVFELSGRVASDDVWAELNSLKQKIETHCCNKICKDHEQSMTCDVEESDMSEVVCLLNNSNIGKNFTSQVIRLRIQNYTAECAMYE